MRSTVSTAFALVAVTLAGVSLAGVSRRSPERAAEARAVPTRAHSGAPSTADAGPRAIFAQEVDPRAVLRDAEARRGAAGHREYYFTRAIYSDYQGGLGWRGRPRWATDYPKADYQFLVVLNRLIGIDAYEGENAVRLDDPEIRRFPFLYALEVSRMDLTDEEVRGLRGYLQAGGFLVVDDFWGDQAMQNLAYQLSRVLPGRPIREIPRDHPLFNAVYDIEEIRQVPNVGVGRAGGPTAECWGCDPRVLGIFDDHDRLMVVINWNTDLGDAWEWAEDPWYPLQYSTFAYEMGVNMVVYGMSH
ncbi:MAG TPA: DUF4159 domain-containing protein [Longimicrobiales bacterium]|nr:DUF4159 domain-containing protein [Longimicrobiales bacterium]